MTLEEAEKEAQKRWGPLAGAGVVRKPGKAAVYTVGISTGMQAVCFGRSDSFAKAFQQAEGKGFTPEYVRSAAGKAARRMKWKRFATAFKGLFK